MNEKERFLIDFKVSMPAVVFAAMAVLNGTLMFSTDSLMQYLYALLGGVFTSMTLHEWKYINRPREQEGEAKR